MTYHAIEWQGAFAVAAVSFTLVSREDAEALAAELNRDEWTPGLARLEMALGPLDVVEMTEARNGRTD